MPNKNATPQNNIASRKADNFRLIHGLPRSAKAKLHAAGILTFAQLAAMSPNEIAAAVGDSVKTTAEQILREDWIGQAGKLTAANDNIVSDAESIPQPSANERRTSFALELKMNEKQKVKQTRVLHVESEQKDAEEIWTGWDETRLLNFIARRAGIVDQVQPDKTQAKKEEGLPTSAVSIEERLRRLQAKSDAATDQSVPSETMSAIELPESTFSVASGPSKKLEVFPKGSNAPSRATQNDQAFSIKILLDSAEIAPLTADELAYTVTVYAKRITPTGAAGKHTVVGKSQGVIAPANNMIFAVEGARLAQGAYRLRAAASFDALGSKPATHNHFMTFIEGGVLQVY